jgi:hypothetical protein
VLVVGVGTESRAKLSQEAKSFAEQSKLELQVLSSGGAVAKYNELSGQGKKVAALIHITC